MAPIVAEYPKKHLILPGDSYWGLAKKYYGKGSLAAHVQKANPGVKLIAGKEISIPAPPPELTPPVASEKTPGSSSGIDRASLSDAGRAGDGSAVRKLPVADAKKAREEPARATEKKAGDAERDLAAKAKAAKEQIYVVQKGDNLSRLAKRFYGDESKWFMIEDANPYLKWELLRAGAKIRIPEAQ